MKLVSARIPKPKPPRDQSLAQLEREHILRVLHDSGFNQTKTARVLGISRPTLGAKLLRYIAEDELSAHYR